MLKTSIETINGELYTVIWRNTVKPRSLLGFRYIPLNLGVLEVFAEAACSTNIATALPALPKHPKPEDAALLYRYLAEGLNVCSTPAWKHGWDLDGIALIQSLSCRKLQAITHAVDADGNRIEVAIKGE